MSNCSELRGSADYSAYCGGAAKHEFPKQTVAVPSTLNSYRNEPHATYQCQRRYTIK